MIRCDVVNCRFNGGIFCNKTILIVKEGKCQMPYDRNGNIRKPEFWVKGWSEENAPVDEAEDSKNLKN